MNSNSTPLVRLLGSLTILYGIVNGLIPLLITLFRWTAAVKVGGEPVTFGVLLLIFTLGFILVPGGIGILYRKGWGVKLSEACLLGSVVVAFGTASLLAIGGTVPGTLGDYGLAWSGWVFATGLCWAVVFKAISTRNSVRAVFDSTGPVMSQPEQAE